MRRTVTAEYEFTTHDNAQASGSQASGSRLMVPPVVVLDVQECPRIITVIKHIAASSEDYKVPIYVIMTYNQY